ncbi:Orotidine 5'-phosphate decarboxylase [Corynebacterium deserti GIMN1.010]|uniref:Orotidine 5'-phosphate decarboxylase n=1 Tax=Corynebacterium deserti GIMN1.010 TaxID=931089 RepID=A0A0M5IJ23_9CORY|nr:orotidine-5'-phosphate decarboxylase [Corynebacterium deserti]ALC06011.1 Orotidine 5'-phosphate decarboxylase [Corynebacterium deserti GIMN1.010]
MTFGEKLLDAATTRGRLCVGIDPHASLLEAWGLPVSVEGLAEFSRACVDAFADTVALVKPQVAFYERFGSQGFAILEETIQTLRERGCLVVADAKRGDIGSTMAGYATAWLDPSSPLSSDAVTVSPYLGFHSLDPVLELAQEHDRGVFVLAATSNPEARELQDQVNADGVSIAQQIVDHVATLNAPCAQRGQAGNVGVVIGATLAHPPRLSTLSGPILMPGVGAQGGTAEDVNVIAGEMSHLAFPNVSRSILKLGPSVADMRNAVVETATDFPGFPRS